MSVPSRVPRRLTTALMGLNLALDMPRPPGVAVGNWRWLVRQRVIAVRDALSTESVGGDGWLAAHGGPALEERRALLTQLADQMSRVLEAADVEAVRDDVKQLAARVQQHADRALSHAADV